MVLLQYLKHKDSLPDPKGLTFVWSTGGSNCSWEQGSAGSFRNVDGEETWRIPLLQPHLPLRCRSTRESRKCRDPLCVLHFLNAMFCNMSKLLWWIICGSPKPWQYFSTKLFPTNISAHENSRITVLTSSYNMHQHVHMCIYASNKEKGSTHKLVLNPV